MPAVSDREYMRHATGRDTADTQAEQMAGHLDDGPQAKPAPHPQPRRPFAARRYATGARTRAVISARPDRSEEGHQARQPSAGHSGGVPAAPAPLPGTHSYGVSAAAEPPPVLDVGPAKPYYSGGMAHGVPAEPEHGGRPAPPADGQLAGQLVAAADEEAGHAPDPVPVFIVTKGAGARPLARAALQQILVPAPGADPIVLVPRNPHRSSVRLLNESANPVRLTGDLTGTGGALLPASMTSYLEIRTQDEICAYQPAGGSGAAAVSVISQYDVPGGG